MRWNYQPRWRQCKKRFQTAYAGMREKQQESVRGIQIIRKIDPALAEVIEVNENGKPRLVSLDV